MEWKAENNVSESTNVVVDTGVAPENLDHFATECRVVIVVPIMADRFKHNITTYKNWRSNGFELEFIATEREGETIVGTIEQHDQELMASLYTYNPVAFVNAG